MADPRDSMNLLPDNERQQAEAALKRATKAGASSEVKLVVPPGQAKKPLVAAKQSFWQKFKEKRAKKKAEAVRLHDEAIRKKSESWVRPPLPKPVVAPIVPPALKPVLKPVAMVASVAKPAAKPVAAPAPLPPKPIETPKPAPIPTKPVAPLASTIPPRKPEVKAVVPKPSLKAERKVEPAKPEKPSLGSKLHQPDAGTDFAGPHVNLVPADVIAQASGQPWGLYASIMVLALAVWVVLSGVAIARGKRAEARAFEWNAKISQVNTAIKNYESGKAAATALQRQFELVKQQIDIHLYWTPFLQKLEETTIPDVYYMSVSANRSGEVHLRAIAKTYEAAARQIRAFELASGFVKSVQVSQAGQELQAGATLPVPVVAFDIVLLLKDDVLTLPSPDTDPAAAATTPASTP
ncbi:MAG: hypothetical protein HY461_02170 [Parcubacteria group bacterium]|nr:hypothetical protein [Parcubacteria group bacterium]